ncbi:MAG: pyridoxal-phosphate dependent enzyme [Chloroflexota bacterium]
MSITTLIPSEIEKAARRLNGIVNKTPVMQSRTLNTQCNAQIFIKCENYQRVGAFKFRGAYNVLSQLSEPQKQAGVVTHSSGNHAQGIALAGKLLGIQTTIVMPDNAPAVKKEATADYGANIVLCPGAEREAVTQALVEKDEFTFVHSYDDDNLIAGQGTAAFELLQEVGELDYLFAPVGGGGLISGTALAAAHIYPNCQVIGVEPANAADANQSWRENQIITFPDIPNTIADGLRVRYIGQRNLEIMRCYLADMMTTTEEEIIETLKFVWSRMKIVIEPSAAVPLAPIFSGNFKPKGKRVGVIFSGGNVDFGMMEQFFKA